MKKLLLLLFVLILGLAVFIVSRPSDFRITRSVTIFAPPSAVFDQVNNFHNWENWSPWAKLDPTAKNSFEGPALGEGAIFRWAGNKEVGEGSMTIIQSRLPDFIKIKLDFIKPFAANNIAEFTFSPEGNKTHVTWSMYGKNNFIGKAIGLFINCDKMVGEMFEKGLAQIKEVVEKR